MNLRLFVFVIPLALVPFGPAFADPREDALEALSKCANVADDKARLSCYDALAPRVKDAIASAPESLAAAPTEEQQKSWFGFDLDQIVNGAIAPTQPPPASPSSPPAPSNAEAPTAVASQPTPPPAPPVAPPPPPPEVDSITAVVTDYSFTPFGRFVIFLDNGEVWRQIDGDTEKASFAKNPKDNTVTISRGMIGSYNLTVNGSKKLFKVKRIK